MGDLAFRATNPRMRTNNLVVTVVMLAASVILAGPGSCKQLGKAGDWKGVNAGADVIVSYAARGHCAERKRTGGWSKCPAVSQFALALKEATGCR